MGGHDRGYLHDETFDVTALVATDVTAPMATSGNTVPAL
jgi:hypothetical protein